METRAESGGPVLDTSAGAVALQECRLRHGDRAWAVLHTGAVISRDDEARVVGQAGDRLPYGVALWPSAIALAHEVAERPPGFRGRSVLALGAGTGLPGIVAATLGGRVVQTDRDALALCQRNGARNGAGAVAYRLDGLGRRRPVRLDHRVRRPLRRGIARSPALDHRDEPRPGRPRVARRPVPRHEPAPARSPGGRRLAGPLQHVGRGRRGARAAPRGGLRAGAAVGTVSSLIPRG
jgi:hypothetical protein